MILKGIIDEDFVNYKKPSMTLMFPYCDFKCDKECGENVCQNSSLATSPNIEVNIDTLIDRYTNNPITKSIVMQGLEVFYSYDDLFDFVHALRRIGCNDDIVIYTGYDYREIYHKIDELSHFFKNIIIKYGRFIPNQQPHYDEVLGVYLASDNQYAERIS